MMVAAAAYGLHARIEVRRDGLQKARPLWWDEQIRFESIERVLLPVTSKGLVLIEGGQPQFRVDGNAFGQFDRRVLQVLRLLPENVEVEHPTGRIDDFRDDNRWPDARRYGD